MAHILFSHDHFFIIKIKFKKIHTLAFALNNPIIRVFWLIRDYALFKPATIMLILTYRYEILG